MTESQIPQQIHKITIGGIELEIFTFENDFRLSCKQVAEEIGVSLEQVTQYLNSIKDSTLFTDTQLELHINQFKHLLPIGLVPNFWMAEAMNGNAKAQELVCACLF